MDSLMIYTMRALEHLEDTVQSHTFLRGLTGITMMIVPFEGEEPPPTWEDAVLRYERQFPYRGASFHNAFSAAERDAYEAVYALMAADKITVQENKDVFLNIVEQFLV